MFTPDALEHMYLHTQNYKGSLEAGGEVFSRTPRETGLVVDFAAGPDMRDKRGPCSFVPDPTAATEMRMLQFDQKRHAVGLWHTHPERMPSPSKKDKRTGELYLKSLDGQLDSYLMIILGNSGDPLNLCVWSVSESQGLSWIQLIEKN